MSFDPNQPFEVEGGDFDPNQPFEVVPTERPQIQGDATLAAGEVGWQLASGAIAAPIAGLAGLATAGARQLGVTQADPADVVRGIQEAMTYQPRSVKGQRASEALGYPFQKLAEGADFAGRTTADVKRAPIMGKTAGGPAGGAFINTAIQALPGVLLSGKMGKPSPGPRTGNWGWGKPGANPAEAAARGWVSSNTSLDWSRLPDSFRAQLTEIAADSKNLSRLNPAAIERQARLAELNVPATRGQITRDPVALRNEGNVSATEAGKPIRDVYVAQNKALIDNLEGMRPKMPTDAATPEAAGRTVQSAARSKLALQERKVKALYKQADEAGETAVKVDATPLLELIEKTPDVTQYGWAQSWMKKVGLEPGAGVPIRDLESLRQAAVARAKDGGTAGHYAGQLIKAIDEATDGAGGNLYKQARAARKAQAMEFDEQSGVARLVSDKSRTDPAVPLEQTWRKTVVGGSIADLERVKRSLLTGGDAATRTAGKQAWRAIQQQTMDHIVGKATKSVSKFEDGAANLTPAALRQAVNEIGPAKIERIFGRGSYADLKKIMDAADDVKTQPPAGFVGSPTMANMLAFGERWVGKIPYAGDVAIGTVKAAAKLREMGGAGREVRSALSSPIDEQALVSRNALRKYQTRRNALAASAVTAQETARR